jgi:RNA polymerase sigma-70 factor (ECF subfamily)
MTAPEHLSLIDTLWSIVRRAHGDQTTDVQAAQRSLLDRYSGAARRYLSGALRDEDAAEEAFQEFALRFVRGDFRCADAERGRFRNFLKSVLFRLVADYHRGRKRRALTNAPEEIAPIEMAAQVPSDEAFLEGWRAELLSRAWGALERKQQETGKPYFAVLRYRVDHPKLRSGELGRRLGEALGRSISAGNMRTLLHRARELFAELLLEEVLQSLERPELADLEEELAELRLLDYCRPALQRLRP